MMESTAADQDGQVQPHSRGLRPLGLRLQPGSLFVTYLFIKEHRGAANLGAALFVCGIPRGCTEAVLSQAMGCFGTVTQCVLHQSQRSGMVVFEQAASRAAALQASARAQIIELDTAATPALQGEPNAVPEAVGLRAWVLEHKAGRPGAEQLQQQLDAWTAAHEAAEERAAAERQAKMGGDGWTVVVRSKGRKKSKEAGGVSLQTGGQALAAAQATAANVNAKAKPVQDFYRFQQRDKRRSELVDLRERFQADKKRITELRAVRNFKPV